MITPRFGETIVWTKALDFRTPQPCFLIVENRPGQPGDVRVSGNRDFNPKHSLLKELEGEIAGYRDRTPNPEVMQQWLRKARTALKQVFVNASPHLREQERQALMNALNSPDLVGYWKQDPAGKHMLRLEMPENGRYHEGAIRITV